MNENYTRTYNDYLSLKNASKGPDDINLDFDFDQYSFNLLKKDSLSNEIPILEVHYYVY